MSFSLAGRVALVTAAGSGIGRASSTIMARQGARVVVTDIHLEAAEAVAEEIRTSGGEAVALRCDVEQEVDVGEAVHAAIEAFGRLDILHNNAAWLEPDVMLDTDILSVPLAVWDRTMGVTLRGTMLGCRHAIPAMLRTGGGSIVNTSSIFGLSAHNQQVAYGCAKAAVNRLTEYVATAYGADGIRCNAVAPSLILTASAEAYIPEALKQAHLASTLTPYLGQPDDVGHLVAFLASDAARFITGEVIRVDGGTLAHLPTFADAKRFYDSVSAH